MPRSRQSPCSTPPRRRRRPSLALPILSIVLPFAACERQPPPDPRIDTTIRHYTVRGVVANLPAQSGESRYLQIHHEQIVPFFNKRGQDVGMNEMTMDFPSLAPGVSLETIAVGDVVEFDLEVQFTREHAWTITRLVELPPDTTLRLVADPRRVPPR